jgi:hypothetical protein
VGPGGDLVAIKSGFASGYSGEGPRTFSYALGLLDAHGVELDEVEVSAAAFKRVTTSALTDADLEAIEARRPGDPSQVYGYIEERHWFMKEEGSLWREFPFVIPFALVERRLTDIALKFWNDPDASLLAASRRLEDVVRKRTGLTNHGAGLFRQAFTGHEAALTWPGLNEKERGARAQLFTSVFAVYRNRRAHRELGSSEADQLSEFLMLNELFRIEAAAIAVDRAGRPPDRREAVA